MKKIIIGLLAYFVTSTAFAQSGMIYPLSKVYVATEKSGNIVVINGDTQEVMKSISLHQDVNGESLSFTAHNVQVSPDGKTVWVTANAGVHDEHDEEKNSTSDENMESTMQDMGMPKMTEHADVSESMTQSDEVIVIDRETDSIIKRIPLAPKAHLAHVVLAPDGKYAYVTAQEGNAIYKIDTATYVIKKIDLPLNSGPHGFRIDSTGKKAYIALMTGKGLGILDIATDAFQVISLDGMAVQAAILPNGKWVFVSLYDTKKLAAYNTESGRLVYVPLPRTSQGPVQLYPSPDGSALYVADQGYLYGRPVNTRVYKLDFLALKIRTIAVGKAPHGITVSKDGKWAYVTNLVGGDVSIINTQTNREMKRVKVGDEPNGISEWTQK